jgi:hypothetical protein
MGEPSKELLDLPSDPRPPASFIGRLAHLSNPPYSSLELLTTSAISLLFTPLTTFWSVLPAESLLAGREQQQQQDKEGKRKSGPPTDPLPKSQGTVELALELLPVGSG